MATYRGEAGAVAYIREHLPMPDGLPACAVTIVCPPPAGDDDQPYAIVCVGDDEVEVLHLVHEPHATQVHGRVWFMVDHVRRVRRDWMADGEVAARIREKVMREVQRQIKKAMSDPREALDRLGIGIDDAYAALCQ